MVLRLTGLRDRAGTLTLDETDAIALALAGPAPDDAARINPAHRASRADVQLPARHLSRARSRRRRRILLEVGGVGYEVIVPPIVEQELVATCQDDDPLLLYVSAQSGRDQPWPILFGFLRPRPEARSGSCSKSVPRVGGKGAARAMVGADRPASPRRSRTATAPSRWPARRHPRRRRQDDRQPAQEGRTVRRAADGASPRPRVRAPRPTRSATTRSRCWWSMGVKRPEAAARRRTAARPRARTSPASRTSSPSISALSASPPRRAG